MKFDYMDVQTSKLELLKTIINIDNDNLISSIRDFIQQKSVDFWDELNEVEQREIKKGIAQLDNGERIEFDKFLEEVS